MRQLTAPPQGRYAGTPQRVSFGLGSLEGLGGALDELGVSRALLVCGPTVAATPMPAAAQAAAPGCELVLYPGSRAHGPREASRQGLLAAREAEAEAVVSLGGSSPVEVARGIALLHGTGKDFDDLQDHPRPGSTTTWPVLAVTTTLSQAEFSNVVGVTNEGTGEKQLFFDDGIMPRHVFLDGELTRYTPERLWLSTGVKALDTGIDIFLQFSATQPFFDALLLDAVSRLVELLALSKDDPEDLGVRQQLQVAAWMAIFPRFHLPVDEAVPRGVPWFGAVARHQLGGLVRAPHGELGGVILPEALVFHLEDAGDRQEALAGALGHATHAELVDGIRDLVAALGLPTRLRDLGVTPEHLPIVVDNITKEQPAFAGRRPEMTVALERMY